MFAVLLVLSIFGISYGIKCPYVNNSDNVSMPALDSKKFSYKIQIIVPDVNKTLDGFEFYDFEKKALFFTVDQSINNVLNRKHTIYDFAYNQTFVVEEFDGSKNCSVNDLSWPLINHSASLFGVGVENGPQGVDHAFYWNGNYSVTFVNSEQLDEVGILTDHYQTCLNFADSNWTYFVDVYFSSPNWSMPAAQQAPVLLRLNATNGAGNERIYLYKFSDYHDSTTMDEEDVPKKPSEIICSGVRKDAPKLVQYTPQFQYSSEIRGHSRSRAWFAHSSEYYDYVNKLMRLDMTGGKRINKVWIHDFTQGLSFEMDRNFGNCSITPIPVNVSFFFDHSISEVNPALVKMYDPREYNRLFNFTFGGFVDYDGVDAEVWISTMPYEMSIPAFSDRTAYLYLTQYIASNSQGRRLGTKEKIIFMNGTSNFTSTNTQSFSNVKHSVSPRVFDVSSCFKMNKKRKVVLKFNADSITAVMDNMTAFEDAFVAAVATAANVSRIRVLLETTSFVAPTSTNEKAKGIYVWVTLLDVANVQGDSVEMLPQSNLSTALDNLRKLVQGKELKVTFMSMQKTKTMTPFKDYWMTEEDIYQPKNSPPPAPNHGLSTGAVIGLALGMVVVGCILGYLVSLRGRRRSDYSYHMQE